MDEQLDKQNNSKVKNTWVQFSNQRMDRSFNGCSSLHVIMFGDTKY
jgi:hypothetical protein